jgi:hypothetical protein
MIPRRTGGAARVVGALLRQAGSRQQPLCVCRHPSSLHAPHGRCWFGHPEAPPEYAHRDARMHLAGDATGPCVCSHYAPAPRAW